MIKIYLTGLDKKIKLLEDMKNAGFKAALEGVAEYLVGDQSHGLKHYPEYKYISINQVGGFVSAKQRRYVMAMIREGKIDPGYPHRTGELQRGWRYGAHGKGYTITNDSPYAKYVMGDDNQSRMHGMIGWRRTAEVIKSNMAGAIKNAQRLFKRWVEAHK